MAKITRSKYQLVKSLLSAGLKIDQIRKIKGAECAYGTIYTIKNSSTYEEYRDTISKRIAKSFKKKQESQNFQELELEKKTEINNNDYLKQLSLVLTGMAESLRRIAEVLERVEKKDTNQTWLDKIGRSLK